VEVKPGGGGSIGGKQVVRAQPDGYTLLLNSSGVNSFAPAVYKDFKPNENPGACNGAGGCPFVMVVNNKLPAKNLSEFIVYAKKNPGVVACWQCQPWQPCHLPRCSFDKAASIQLLPCPTRALSSYHRSVGRAR